MELFRSFRSAMKRIIPARGNTADPDGVNRVPKTDIPGMVSSAETSFFSECAARYCGREGAIVDLGCWLGSTSIALAQGIQAYGGKIEKRNEKVFGFDMFQWETWMPDQIPYCLYEPGDSFLAEARRVVREHGSGRVELVRADLELYEWSGDPIKILLIDAMKNEKLAVQIPRNFFPSLIPGGLLIQQDFKHYYTSWIHPLQYQLRQYFRFYQSVPNGTVAFEVLTPIPKQAVHRATEFATLPDDIIDASFDYSLGLVAPEEQANIAAAHVTHYVHLKRIDGAFRMVEHYRPTGMLDKGEFPQALALLNRTAP